MEIDLDDIMYSLRLKIDAARGVVCNQSLSLLRGSLVPGKRL